MEPINAIDLITDDVAEKSAQAAQELIKQSGWDIVIELDRAVADGLNATALVVLPVSVNLEKYKAKLTDPEGFEAKFNTLRADVHVMTKAALALHNTIEGRTGAPADEDEVTLIRGLTMGYTKVQGHLESAVHPLMLNLVSQLEDAGFTELTVEGEDNAE